MVPTKPISTFIECVNKQVARKKFFDAAEVALDYDLLSPAPVSSEADFSFHFCFTKLLQYFEAQLQLENDSSGQSVDSQTNQSPLAATQTQALVARMRPKAQALQALYDGIVETAQREYTGFVPPLGSRPPLPSLDEQDSVKPSCHDATCKPTNGTGIGIGAHFPVPAAIAAQFESLSAPLNASSKVTEWQPRRLQRLPTAAEMDGYVTRREPFILSLPSERDGIYKPPQRSELFEVRPLVSSS